MVTAPRPLSTHGLTRSPQPGTPDQAVNTTARLPRGDFVLSAELQGPRQDEDRGEGPASLSPDPGVVGPNAFQCGTDRLHVLQGNIRPDLRRQPQSPLRVAQLFDTFQDMRLDLRGGAEGKDRSSGRYFGSPMAS